MSRRASGGTHSRELTREPGVAREPLAAGERGKSGGLSHIAAITLDDVECHVQPAEARGEIPDSPIGITESQPDGATMQSIRNGEEAAWPQHAHGAGLRRSSAAPR
jgi:hypothetical protein